MATVEDLIDRARYELDDTSVTGEKQYTDAELLAYYNKWHSTIHRLLVYDRSEMVVSSGTATLADGDSSKTFAALSITDFWSPFRVWIAGYDPMELVNESAMLDYEQTDGTLTSGQPGKYYIEAATIYFLPEADAAYTVKIKYFPSFTPVTDDTTAAPFYGLFDQQLVEGIILQAKVRGRKNPAVEAAMVQLHQEIAWGIAEHRRDKEHAMYPEQG